MFAKVSNRIRLIGGLAVVAAAFATQAFGAAAAAEPCYDAYYDALRPCAAGIAVVQPTPTAGGAGAALSRAM